MRKVPNIGIAARLTGCNENEGGTGVGDTSGGSEDRSAGGTIRDGLVDTDIVGGRLGRGNRAVPCASLVSRTRVDASEERRTRS